MFAIHREINKKSEILETYNNQQDAENKLKALVTQIASGLDIKTAHTSPKMFNLKDKYGKGMVIKILCAIHN
jgi:hypothetical protein